MNGKKIRTDLLLALFSQGFYKLVGFAVLAILTRYLTKEDMGAFFFAATFAGVGAMLTELGTNTWLMRKVSADNENAVGALGQVLSARILFAAGYFILINIFAWFFRHEIWLIITLSSVYIILEEIYKTLGGFFLGIKRIAFNVASGVTSRLLLVVLVFLVTRLEGDLPDIVLCYIAANVLLLSIALVLARRTAGPIRIEWKTGRILSLVRLSLPLFLIQILAMIHFRIDSLMIGFLRTYADVATYESSFRLLEASRFLTLPISMVFFPLFAELAARKNWLELKSHFFKVLSAAGGMGAAVAITVLLAGGLIIPFVYGSRYDDSIGIVRILFISVPMIYATRVASISALSMGLEKRLVPLLLICVIINIGLNWIAIPRWGVQGAAWTTFITETLLSVWMLKLVITELKQKTGSTTGNGMEKERTNSV